MNDTADQNQQMRNQKLEALKLRSKALLEEVTWRRKQYELAVDLWAKVRDEVKLIEHETEIYAEVQRRLDAQPKT